MGAKGGDKDWYGYCVGDPVNRVDAWGLWSLFGFGGEEQKSSEGNTEQSRTGRDDNPYCKVYPCDDNGTMQGDYKPIDIHEGTLPFLLDFSVPIGGKRVTILPSPEVDPFYDYYKRKEGKAE